MHLRLSAALFGAAALTVLVAAPSASAAAAGQGAVVAPRAGQVMHSNVVAIRVAADARGVRLNGKRIGPQFGLPRNGVRTLRASISQGLRRGGNVIGFHRGGGRREVHFVLRRRGPLVGAGVDERAATDGVIDLRGRVQGRASGLRWKLLDAPEGATEAVGSPAGNTASFRATMPGSYTFALGAGAQSQDRVTVAAVARNLLVPVDTMADSKGVPGIQVGQTFYPRQGPTDFNVQLQVLVLKRATLERVSNDTYPDASQLSAAIGKLNSTNLVIVSDLGPNRTGTLPAQLARIGVAQFDYPSGTGRVFSAVGVPGMKPGEAHVLFNPGQSSGGQLRGYLTPDQYNNYRFVRPERIPFQEGGSEGDPCGAGDQAPACKANVGFRLNVYDAFTREARAGDNRVYNTGGANVNAQQQTAEVNRLAGDLSKIAPGDTAVLLSVGLRAAGQDTYPAHIGTGVDESAMANLALQITSIGGSPDAFNRAALARGPAGGSGLPMPSSAGREPRWARAPRPRSASTAREAHPWSPASGSRTSSPSIGPPACRRSRRSRPRSRASSSSNRAARGRSTATPTPRRRSPTWVRRTSAWARTRGPRTGSRTSTRATGATSPG